MLVPDYAPPIANVVFSEQQEKGAHLIIWDDSVYLFQQKFVKYLATLGVGP
jgi:hypothetical protein